MTGKYMDLLFNNQWKTGKAIPFWDGKTAKRIVDTIVNKLIKN